MTETTSHVLACIDCGRAIEKKPGGGTPKYCPSCATERVRICNRDAARRRRAGLGPLPPRTYTCVECKREFVHSRRGGQQPERCLDCRQDRIDGYMAEYRIRRGHAPVGSTITLICGCGTPFEWTVVVGRRAWKCRTCLDAAYVNKKRRDAFMAWIKRPAPNLARVCIDCGRNFQQRNALGPIVTRCPRCAEDRSRSRSLAYGRRLSQELSEARRLTFEIEGRWSYCLNCGKALPCERMGLVRKWCEDCLPERKKAVLQAWKLANPEAWRAIACRANQVRRARLAAVPSEPYDRRYIFDRDKWICQLCKKRIYKKYVGHHPKAPSIDHQIPLELGGPDTPANVTAAHFGCNSAKRSRYMPNGEQLMLLG